MVAAGIIFYIILVQTFVVGIAYGTMSFFGLHRKRLQIATLTEVVFELFYLFFLQQLFLQLLLLHQLHQLLLHFSYLLGYQVMQSHHPLG